MCFYKVICFVFDGIRISRIKIQKYNNPVMICKIFVSLTELPHVDLAKQIQASLMLFLYLCGEISLAC